MFRLAVDGAHGAESSARARTPIGDEIEIGAVGLEPPVLGNEHDFAVIGLALIAIDDQHAGKTVTDLARLVAMGMEEESAGVGRGDVIEECPARLDGGLRYILHAV